MEVIEKRASGAAGPDEGQDFDTLATDIVTGILRSSGKESRQSGAARGSRASADTPGLYMAALTQRVVPQLEAMVAPQHT